MVGFKGFLAGAVAVVVAAAGVQAQAAVSVSVLSDTGTLVTTTYAPPSSTSSNSVPSPYGAGAVTVTPITATSWKVTFHPSSGFFVSANNLSGGKTSIFDGLIAFDITFDGPINLTANIYEDGIYSKTGNGRVAVNSPDLPSGVVISQLDNLLLPEQKGNSFVNTAVVSFQNSGIWTLYDQVKGFSKAYTKYHVVIDNALLAESLVNPNLPSFAAIAKKDFSIIFTSDGSNGGGPIPNPDVPEPASLGVLALGSLALLARRRK